MLNISALTVAEPETRNTRPAEEGTLGQDDVVTQTDDREDRHCTCYNCRKESPSTRGRAVPRCGLMLSRCP